MQAGSLWSLFPEVVIFFTSQLTETEMCKSCRLLYCIATHYFVLSTALITLRKSLFRLHFMHDCTRMFQFKCTCTIMHQQPTWQDSLHISSRAKKETWVNKKNVLCAVNCHFSLIYCIWLCDLQPHWAEISISHITTSFDLSFKWNMTGSGILPGGAPYLKFHLGTSRVTVMLPYLKLYSSRGPK